MLCDSKETTQDFPIFLLLWFLGDLYELVYSVILSPVDGGFPISRPRRYTLLQLRLSQWKFIGNIEEFFLLFCRRVQAHGDVYAIAPDKELQDALAFARAAGHLATSFTSALSTGQRQRLEMQEVVNDDEDVLFDIEQTPRFTSRGPSCPCLTQSSTLWTTASGRTLLPKEHLLAQGQVHVVDMFELLLSLSVRF